MIAIASLLNEAFVFIASKKVIKTKTKTKTKEFQMKLRIFSDLHLSRRNWFEYNYLNEDIVIAAGDIDEGLGGIDFLDTVVPKKIPVLYVPGNHEYYGQNYHSLNKQFRNFNKTESNVKVLLNDVYETEKVLFVGSTLWTDFNVFDTQDRSAEAWERGLNDCNYISTDNGKLTRQDVIFWNQEAIKFLEDAQSDKPMVLITHYCPEQSLGHKWVGSDLNPGFITKIPAHIHNKFVLHIHGHTHDSADYQLQNGPRVVCNPKGYGAENAWNFEEKLLVEV